MKLLMENWRDYIEKGEPGTGTPWERGGSTPVDRETVKIIEGPMSWGHYLFIVVEYESPINGKKKKVGFYMSSGRSISGTEHTAKMWLPVGGIGTHPAKGTPWIIKHPQKYPHPDTELGQVTKQLGELIPPSEGERMRIAGLRARNQQRRVQGVKAWDIEDQQKDAINATFSKHGVFFDY